MIDLFESAKEMAEERAAIREFDGLMTRDEAERLGKLDAEEWRHACEVRTVVGMASLNERRDYLAKVESKRGKDAADKLRGDVHREWMARRMEMAGQA